MNSLSFRIGLQRSRSLLLTVFILIVLMTFTLWTIISLFGASTVVEQECYFALALEGFYFSVAIMLRNARKPIYIFEPYALVTCVYVLIYFVAPVIQFSTGNPARFGVDVTEYAFPACILVIIGHISYCLAYSGKVKRRNERLPQYYAVPTNKPAVVRVGYTIWAISALAVIYYQTTRGFDLSYILTGGLGGTQDVEVTEGSLQFLSYFSYALIASWMLVFAFGRGYIMKFLMFAITLVLLFFGGTRAAILIPLLAPIVFLYISQNKSPSLWAVLGSVLLLVILFAIMQVSRVGIRTGSGFDLAGETLSSLFEPFLAEIEDYKAFYALLGVVPTKHGFLFGSQMIGYSLVILVPRALWPGKPMPEIYELVRLAFGDYAVDAGVAYPALGEYYVEFGVAGVVICMYAFGFLCRYIRGFYVRRSGASLSLVMYSILFPAIFQFIIRGYMPQNFTMALFLIAPVIAAAIVDNKKRHKFVRV